MISLVNNYFAEGGMRILFKVLEFSKFKHFEQNSHMPMSENLNSKKISRTVFEFMKVPTKIIFSRPSVISENVLENFFVLECQTS